MYDNKFSNQTARILELLKYLRSFSWVVVVVGHLRQHNPQLQFSCCWNEWVAIFCCWHSLYLIETGHLMYLMRYKIYIYLCSTFFKYLVLTYFCKILEIEVFKYSPVIVEISFHIGFNLMHTAICKK